MPESRLCPNCGRDAPDQYCPQCGQAQIERRTSVRHLLNEVFEEQFGLNVRAPHTFRALLLQPGVLTLEYFSGRIQRYIGPFKLYLVASVVFFLVAGISLPLRTRDLSERINSAAARMNQVARQAPGEKVSIGFGAGTLEHFYGIRLVRVPTQNWLRDSDVDFGIAPLNAAARDHLHHLATLGPQEGTRQLVRSLLNQVPRVLFVLLPVYALLLYVCYRRQRRYFVEHFVFALHLHAFVFFTFALVWLPILFVMPLVMLWNIAYTLVAQHRFYQQSYGWVVAKSFGLSIAYMIFFSVGVLTSLALALTIG